MALPKPFQSRRLRVSRFIQKAAGLLTTGLSVAASGFGVASHEQTPADFISSLHKKKVYKRRATHKTNPQQSQRQEEKHELDSQSILESGNSNAQRIDPTKHSAEGSKHDADEDSDEDPLENFSEVMAALDLGKLQQAALMVRLLRTVPERCTALTLEEAMSMSCEIHPVPKNGSYNLAYLITFPDGVKWVARIPGHGYEHRWEELDRSKMESEYRTLQLIGKNTSIPVPKVLHYDTSCAYAGAPFALMSCVEGTSLADLWMHELPEEKRLKVLSEIAAHMSQLHNISFDRVGMPEFEELGRMNGIGKCITLMGHEYNPWHSTQAFGPHDTFLESLWDAFDEHEDMHVNQRSDIPILRMAIQSMPDYLTQDRQFYLSNTDFALQNILVDEECHVTGFIDWDGVQSEAASAGYARYPSWITRDWDPIMYGFDEDAPFEGPSANESSPETLSRYRQHYAPEFARHASGFEDYDPRMTILSHLVEAISLAVVSNVNRSEIVEKLLDHAFEGKVPFKWLEYVRDYREGRRSKKDEMIKKAFAKMWHAEWEKPSAQAPEEDEDAEAGTSVASKIHIIEVKIHQIEDGKDVVESEDAGPPTGMDSQASDESQQSSVENAGEQQQHPLQAEMEDQKSHEGQHLPVEVQDIPVEGQESCDEGDERQQPNQEGQDEVDSPDEGKGKGLAQGFKQRKHQKLLKSFSKSHSDYEKTAMCSNIKKQARRIIGMFKKKQPMMKNSREAASDSEKS